MSLTDDYRLFKIFSKLYVGFQSHGENQPLLGFAAPYEDNAAGKKRMATVDSWARPGSDYVKQADGKYETIQREGIPTKIVDNVPVAGFKIADDIRRTYWGGGNVVWRVLDPRGYELEISSANLSRIIDSVGLSKGGEIPVKCVWGRLGPQNILIPEGSDLWDKTLKDAEKMKELSASVGKNGYSPGDIVITKSGAKKVYLGKHNAVCVMTAYDDAGKRGYNNHKAYHSVKVIDGMQLLGDYDETKKSFSCITAYKALKIVRVDGALHIANIEDLINDFKIQKEFAGNGSTYDGLEIIGFNNSKELPKFEYKDLPSWNAELGYDGWLRAKALVDDPYVFRTRPYLFYTGDNDRSATMLLNRVPVKMKIDIDMRLAGRGRGLEVPIVGLEDISSITGQKILDLSENGFTIVTDQRPESYTRMFSDFTENSENIKRLSARLGLPNEHVRSVRSVGINIDGKFIPLTTY